MLYGNDQDEHSLHMTGDYIVSQFRQILPQIHLTLISVLQGLALGALLLNFGQPQSAAPADVARAFLQHAFYLPQLASFLMIVTIWVQYMYVVFTLPWPLNYVNTALQFLLVVPEVAAFSTVNHVGIWVLWVGVIGLIGTVIRIRNPHIVSKELFRKPAETAEVPALYTGEMADDNLLHTWRFWAVGFAIIALGYLRELGLLPSLLIGSIPFPLGTSFVPFDVAVPLVVTIVLVWEMIAQDRDFAARVNAVFTAYNTPYQVKGTMLDAYKSGSTEPRGGKKVASENLIASPRQSHVNPTCEFFSGDEVGEMQPGTTQRNVREDRHGMHEDFTQEPTAQMPQIVGPDALDGSTLDELAEDGVDAVAPAGESTAQSWPGILFSAAEGGQELDAALGELLTEAWRPEVAIADDEAGGAFGEVVSGGEFLPIAWSELDLADGTRPADARMQAEAVERLLREVIMAIGSLSPAAPAARGARELANRECEAVNDGELRIVRDLGADPLPDPIFHHLQVLR